MSLEQAALQAHNEAEKIRKEKQLATDKKNREAARKTQEILIEDAKTWAVPILNRVFGERSDWILRDAVAKGPLDPYVSVSVDINIRDGKSLTVYPDGRVEGWFEERGWSGGSTVIKSRVTSLEDLGHKLQTERDIWDYDRSHAD